MTLTAESDAIAAVEAYTYLSVQTAAEATALTGLTKNLLYATAGRTQGNFSLYYAMAQAQLAKDCATYGITLTAIYTNMAYAYLIQYYFEKKYKNWNAQRISSGDDSVQTQQSGAWQAYQEVLAMFKTTTTTIERHIDYTNYPTAWKNTQLVPETIELVNP